MKLDREAIYTLTQVIVTIGLVGTAIFMAVTGKEVPDLLSSLATLSVGYFFGTQTEKRVIAGVR